MPSVCHISTRLGNKEQDGRSLAAQGSMQTEAQETSQSLAYRLWKGWVEGLQNQTQRGEWLQVGFLCPCCLGQILIFLVRLG